MRSNPMVVLLVEDDCAHAEIVRRNLARSEVPCNLVRVSDGQMAYDYLHQRNAYSDPDEAPRPGLVLLDLSLPKVSGLELLEIIKKDPLLRRIPVVVLTNSDSENDIHQAYGNHANSYLIKPSNFEKFQELSKILSHYWLAWNQTVAVEH